MDYKDTLGEIHKYMSNMDYKHAKNCIATFLVNTKIADLSYDDLSSLFCDSVTIGATSSIIVCIKRLNKDYIRGYSSTRIGNLVVNLLTGDATHDISIESMASLTDYEKSVMYYIRYMTFKNIEDLKKIHVGSTGGTDVRCVFEYLNGETKVDGKYEKHKPKEMAAVIIITDGCFYNNYEDYAKIFGKPSYKVIWMIEGNAMDFKPPFGNVVQITRQGD